MLRGLELQEGVQESLHDHGFQSSAMWETSADHCDEEWNNCSQTLASLSPQTDAYREVEAAAAAGIAMHW